MEESLNEAVCLESNYHGNVSNNNLWFPATYELTVQMYDPQGSTLIIIGNSK